MRWLKETLEIQTRDKGLHPFTGAVEGLLRQWGYEKVGIAQYS